MVRKIILVIALSKAVVRNTDFPTGPRVGQNQEGHLANQCLLSNQALSGWPGNATHPENSLQAPVRDWPPENETGVERKFPVTTDDDGPLTFC